MARGTQCATIPEGPQDGTASDSVPGMLPGAGLLALLPGKVLSSAASCFDVSSSTLPLLLLVPLDRGPLPGPGAGKHIGRRASASASSCCSSLQAGGKE